MYNTIIGKFFGGDLNSVKIFLNGEIENSYLRRLFQPFSLFYFFFNPETAYWIIDVLVKLTSYFSFYILAKKISLKKFESALVACLFTCINLRSHDGFGIAITPYLVYLLAFKKSFKFKNYFIIFFSGLNTDFATCMPQIPAIIFASYILNKNNFQKYIRNNFLIIGTFTFFVFIKYKFGLCSNYLRNFHVKLLFGSLIHF